MRTPLLLATTTFALASAAGASPAQVESPCGRLGQLGQWMPGMYTELNLVSSDGNVLAGEALSTSGLVAVRWSELAGYEDLGALPGLTSFRATAINGNGTTIVGTGTSAAPSSTRPFRWDETVGMQALDFTPFLASEFATAGWVSDDGAVAAGTFFNDASGSGDLFEVALVWVGTGAPSTIRPPGFGFSRPVALSGDGSTLVGTAFNLESTPFGTLSIAESQAFAWSSSTGYSLIGTLNDGFDPVDVSFDGSIVLGNQGAPSEAVLWSQGSGYQMTGADQARSLSSDGTTVVGRTTVASELRAYRWQSATGVQVLGGPAGGRSSAFFVSSDGSVVAGTTRNAAFESAVFRWSELAGWENIGLGLVSDPFSPEGMSENGRVIGGSTRFGATRGLRWTASDIGSTYCAANANSVGQAAALRACGCDEVAANDLELFATSLPPSVIGIMVASQTQSPPTAIANSVGVLCLGGAIGRFVGPGQILSSSAADYDGTGSASLPVDLTRIPTPVGLVTVQAGETWNFQMWYRDTGAGTGPSNLTSPVSVTFQ